MNQNFLGPRHGRNVFEFDCPRCGSTGELGIRLGRKQLTECPEQCGALFMVRKGSGMYARPTLAVVNEGAL